MSEPPSAPDSSTACSTIVVSTSSGSRVELIASPTSARASISSTLRASSADRAWRAAEQLDVAQGQRRLLGERRQQGAGVLVERLDRGAPDREDADHLVVDDHRRPDDRPVAGQPLELGQVVVGVGQHVVDLLGAAVQGDPPDQGGSVPVDRVRVR